MSRSGSPPPAARRCPRPRRRPGRRSCGAYKRFRSTTPRCPWTGTSPSTPAVPGSTSSSTPWAARPWPPPSRRCAPAPVMRSARRAGGTHALAPLSFRAAPYSGEFTLLPNLTGWGRQHHGEILRETANLVDEGAPRPVLDATRYTLTDATDAHRTVENATADGKAVIDVEPRTRPGAPSPAARSDRRATPAGGPGPSRPAAGCVSGGAPPWTPDRSGPAHCGCPVQPIPPAAPAPVRPAPRSSRR